MPNADQDDLIIFEMIYHRGKDDPDRERNLSHQRHAQQGD